MNLESLLKETENLDWASKYKTNVNEGLSTGSHALNFALSGNPNFGYAYGRFVEIFGPIQTGKTTSMLHLMHEAQKSGLTPMLVDAEYSFSNELAQSIGIDLNKMVLCKPDYAEQAFQNIESALENGVRLVIIDSVPALKPKAEFENSIEAENIGLQARVFARACRKLKGLFAQTESILVFVNQIRVAIGQRFGNPETTPGGRSIAFYSDYRVDIRSPRSGAQKVKEDTVLGKLEVETGIDSKVCVVKNKLHSPRKTTFFQIAYGKGFSKKFDLLQASKDMGLFEETKEAKGGVGIRLVVDGKDVVYTEIGLKRALRSKSVIEALEKRVLA